MAKVPDWSITTAVSAVLSGNALESEIAAFATAQGIDVSQPFPFQLEGEFQELKLHVINGYCPIATDPATQEAQPWQFDMGPGHAHVVGFFAPNAVAVLTHHGTQIHAHGIVQTKAGPLAGHVDQLITGSELTLSVPKPTGDQ